MARTCRQKHKQAEMFEGPLEISPFGVILRKQDAVSHFIQCEAVETQFK